MGRVSTDENSSMVSQATSSHLMADSLMASRVAIVISLLAMANLHMVRNGRRKMSTVLEAINSDHLMVVAATVVGKGMGMDEDMINDGG